MGNAGRNRPRPAGMTRRGFLAAVAAGQWLPLGQALGQGGRSARVVVARGDDIRRDEVSLKQTAVSRLLDAAVQRLLDAKDAAAAWGELFDRRDVVALKVNCLAGRRLSTHPDVAMAIAQGVAKAGVPWGNIYIWERADRELKGAGFEIQTGSRRVRCVGTDNHLVGGYDSRIRFAGSVGSLFSRMITERATALVDVPVLKDHDLAGVTLGMKNFYGSIHNPNKYHENNCDPYIAELCTYPGIRGKLRLVVVDGALAQANAGPAYNAKYAWNFNGLIVGRDVVAVDSVAADIIEGRRRQMKLPALAKVGRQPKYIQTAQRLRLGVADLDSIEVVEL